MTIFLDDGTSVTWRLGVNTGGLLTTTVSSGVPTTLFLSNGSQNYEVGVTPTGNITTTLVGSSSFSNSFILIDSIGNSWALTVLAGGFLQTTFAAEHAWVQNGFGAGTDNSVIGGLGGFMAYPQPPTPVNSFSTPEAVGQFGPLNITVDNTTVDVTFVIQNPGRR